MSAWAISDSQISSKWKPYGTPLVLSISSDDEISGGKIQKMVQTILSPMLRTENLEHTNVSGVRSATAGSDPALDLGSGKECTESAVSNSANEDVTSSKPVTSFELPLQLMGENNTCIDLSAGEEKAIRLASSSPSILIYVDWSQKLLQKHDTHFLENLPEVFKYGPVTKKARTEPLSLYTCLEAFLREEPLVPEDMWLDSTMPLLLLYDCSRSTYLNCQYYTSIH